MSNQSFNILNDFPPEKYNLLVPVQSIQEINPIYKIVVNKVIISTNLADKEIYEEKNAAKVNNQPMYALTHKGLLKLHTAANGRVVISKRVRSRVCEKCYEIVKATQQAPACGNCPCSANVAWKVKILYPDLSGSMVPAYGSKEIDFSNMTTATPNQIARMKEYASEHAESKAMSRAMRKGLNVKNAYTLEELKKPFIVAYPVLNSNDADVKKALIAGYLAATNLLYGSGLSVPQIGAGPNEIDAETEEFIDSDYDVEQPDINQNPPWGE